MATTEKPNCMKDEKNTSNQVAINFSFAIDELRHVHRVGRILKEYSAECSSITEQIKVFKKVVCMA